MTRSVTLKTKFLLASCITAAFLVASGGVASAGVSGSFNYDSYGDHVAVTGCAGGVGSCPNPLIVPSTIEGLPVTEIDDYAFYNGTFTSATLPSSLRIIGGDAFEQASSLTSIVIPEGVTLIKGAAFHKATSLTSVTLPSTLKTIEGEAFYEARALKSISLPAGLEQLGPGAFASTTSVTGPLTIPSAITRIEDYTFSGAGITSLTLSSNLTFIGTGAFGDAKLTSLTIPASVGYLGNDSFRHITGLTRVTFLGNAPALGARVFLDAAAGATAKLASCTLTGYGFNGDLFGGLIVTGGKANESAACSPSGGSGGGSVVSKLKFGGRSGNLTVPAGRKSVPIAFTSSQVGSFTLSVKRGSRVVKTQTGSIKLGANKILLVTKRLAASKYRVVLTLETTPPPGRRARGAVPASTRTTVTRYLTVKRAAFTG